MPYPINATRRVDYSFYLTSKVKERKSRVEPDVLSQINIYVHIYLIKHTKGNFQEDIKLLHCHASRKSRYDGKGKFTMNS